MSAYLDKLANPNDPYFNSNQESTVKASSNSALDNQRSAVGRPNPLDDYANYTYGISLHVIPRETWNSIANTNAEYTPRGTVLIASGGRSDEKLSFSEFFNKADFYIERLQLNTVVGLNSRSRSSNVVDLTFVVVEPIGMTLLNRLLLTARKFKFLNWGQMPFMLQIDFFGNNDEGKPVKIESQTKYIPVKIVDCKIKVSTKGSEYTFSAVPFSHQALLESAASTPASFEVHADSVGNFFNYAAGSDPDAQSGTFAKKTDIEAQVNERIRSGQEIIRGGGRSGTAVLDAAVRERNELFGSGSAWRINSFAAALNSNQKQMVRRKWQTVADEIYFEIHPDIANAKLVFPDKNPTRNSSLKKANEIEARRATLGPGSASIQVQDQALTINSGTSIIDVINFVIRNSEYVTKQVQTDKNNTSQENKVIKWFKITCKVELLDYDRKRNVQGKKFTYFVQPYEYYNTKYPEAPTMIPDKWEKQYYYSYTGQNQSIIDFDLDFNVMFFTAITAIREAKSAIEPGTDVDSDDIETSDGPSQNNTSNTGMPRQYRNLSYQGSTQLVAGRNDEENMSANDLYNSIMSNSRGDMVNVKIKIAGDPEFIKQDDVFFNPSTQTKSLTTIDKNNGSLIMDASEIFAKLVFKIPTDINQNTGMMDLSLQNNSGQVLGTNIFDGVYKIITVENNFDRGNFTQVLDMVRLFGQDRPTRNDNNRRTDANNSNQADAEETELELLNNSDREYALSESTLEEPLILLNEASAAPPDDTAEDSAIAQQVEKIRSDIANASETSIATNSDNQGDSWVFGGFRG